jgi:hypothetical protein
MVDHNSLASVELVERLFPGRGVTGLARAWEVPRGSVKSTDCLRVRAWASVGVPKEPLLRELQRAELRRLAAG